jgi:hypothetical protein
MTESDCPHIEAGVRLNELSEVEICASCGIEIEDLYADEPGDDS